MDKWDELKDRVAEFVGGETDEQILSALQTVNITTKIKIDTLNIEKYLTLQNLWLSIADSTSISARTAVQVLRRFETLDYPDPIVEVKLISILDALVAEVMVPDFTEAHKAAILSMGSITQSWEQKNWNTQLRIGDIQNAK